MHSTSRLLGAELLLTTDRSADELETELRRLCATTPFRLVDVSPDGTGLRCRLVAAHPELALTWRNVVELQWRIGGHVEIGQVNRLDTADSGLLLASA